MVKILISGGSGALGKAISQMAVQKGFEVAWLSRKGGVHKGIRAFEWDPEEKRIDPAAWVGVTHLIHLAGAGIFDKQWTAQYRRQILDSRVKSSELLFDSVQQNNVKLKAMSGMSAVGFYGLGTSDHPMTEREPRGSGFLAEVCDQWEKSYSSFAAAGIRTTIFRMGVMLDKDSGILSKLSLPVRLGMGAAFGSGRQFFPWIHIHDAAAAFLESIVNETMEGTYNLVSYETITNKEFIKELTSVMKKPFFLPALPSPLLRMLMGEKARSLTEGHPVSNKKLLDTGFRFHFPAMRSALSDLLITK